MDKKKVYKVLFLCHACYSFFLKNIETKKIIALFFFSEKKCSDSFSRSIFVYLASFITIGKEETYKKSGEKSLVTGSGQSTFPFAISNTCKTATHPVQCKKSLYYTIKHLNCIHLFLEPFLYNWIINYFAFLFLFIILFCYVACTQWGRHEISFSRTKFKHMTNQIILVALCYICSL